MSSFPDVTFSDLGNKIVLENGIVQVTLSKPGGLVTGVKYGGLDNLLEVLNKETNRGYWDLNWSEPDGRVDNFDVPDGTTFEVVRADGDIVEVSFVRPYNDQSEKPMVPLTIDKRFALHRGHSGFYTCGIYERLAGWRDFNLNQTRIAFKLRKDRFQHMAVAENKIRLMPLPDDLSPDRAQQLAYKEAHLLVNPRNPTLKGEVDDKYQYLCENQDNKIHGWMSQDPLVGFWIITASNEFRNGGPVKQDLTSHTGPTCLSMWHSAHLAGIELCPQFRNQEPWQKIFGPVYIYLNSAPAGTDMKSLWEEAKEQMNAELPQWPYSWPSSPKFAKAADRGQISGRILVHDRFAKTALSPGANAYLGLALPGAKGSWQRDSKGYQFWSRADSNGNFSIKNVLPGVYDLYGWVPGVFGDYKREGETITITAGGKLELGDVVYEPPRDGPTVWEIGTPTRTAEEFYIPDVDPKYINRLPSLEKWRQYGLWERYTELYPTEDLIYTVGASDWSKDWFYAHLCRKNADGTYSPTTWQIRFQLPALSPNLGDYKLRMAIASSNLAAVQVRVNDASSADPVFDTKQVGRCNAIARHGIHGLYWAWNVNIPAALLKQGENVLYLTQPHATGPFNGVQYDYLRLEAPAPPAAAAAPSSLASMTTTTFGHTERVSSE
ncbi:rhamnogalacturonan endolyase [Marchantia polymorpha subsp. ruderalis]|uniref:rhamnogalacturonan endolyase n=2 Tax=Marchantia polymorpha TaxID=3197 RepID=A0A176W1L9_MARPO|nr:hypothetical protein AXG93_2277s1070 [Marchantia polymorpha subsp. ruderalis]PTQ27232.1 hypothetical protein MARPO_0212s0010 [Marchantia polymorpha]BBN04267.1 hypothetical protein Mp_3g03160 [Marchantia polymorpha subsp. ruderalis]|eukprot:PTQ27232.1 hypothetical protein MARPO_0212s0010 [Marchantia polymorpha]